MWSSSTMPKCLPSSNAGGRHSPVYALELISPNNPWCLQTSTIRLFGDIHQQSRPMRSSIGQELAKTPSKTSLLARLSHGGPSSVNFHLGQQHRSHPAIHEWPNRAFYKEGAAKPTELARNISLENCLRAEMPPKTEKSSLLPSAPPLITDPLVLVDLSRLEGGWRPDMLQVVLWNCLYYFWNNY